MDNMEEIDQRLWEYLDGVCTAEEHAAISALIAMDPVWKGRHHALIVFQQSLRNDMDLEQPSMRFNQNIMEAIGAATIAPATGKYINKWVIRALALLFVIPLIAISIYALITADWSAGSGNPGYPLNFLTSGFDKLSGSRFWSAGILINLMLGLLLLDTILRSKFSRREQH